MATLGDYLADTRRLLRDSGTSPLYSTPDLTSFINRAMQQRDLDLGLNRSRVSFTLITGQAQYSIASILATGNVLTGSAAPNMIDILSIVVIPLGQAPGGVRYPLGRWPYSRLAYLISTSYPTYPVAYAMYGTQTVILGPPPAGAYPSEFDFFGYASPLVLTTDADPQPYPWTDPVPFLAAHFAKVQAQRFDEAKNFWDLYMLRLSMVRARGRPLAITKPFADLPRGAR